MTFFALFSNFACGAELTGQVVGFFQPAARPPRKFYGGKPPEGGFFRRTVEHNRYARYSSPRARVGIIVMPEPH